MFLHLGISEPEQLKRQLDHGDRISGGLRQLRGASLGAGDDCHGEALGVRAQQDGQHRL